MFSRIANVFLGSRLNREIDEELASHVEEAVSHGRDPAEARAAFGSALRAREQSRDFRILSWLDALRADTVFGWRQLKKNKASSCAVILSLALSIGACTSAFRLMDALLFRPLPILGPGRLHAMVTRGIGPSGSFRTTDSNEYPQFRLMRAAVKDRAELIAVSWCEQVDLTFRSDLEMEKAYRQYVSGWMFGSFGLKPALGRLFSESDDLVPGAHPYAVLSYDYWRRRFGQDPKVLGRSFRMGARVYEIVGVAPEPFTGTEPGAMTDVFIPTMMNPYVDRDDSSWIRTFILFKPGTDAKPVRDRLQAIFDVVQHQRAKGFTGWPKQRLERFLNQTVLVEPAAGGVSGMRQEYSRALTVLAVLVALVLLIACANAANLLTAQAVARGREMALRVSIGAGRARLIQLVLVESAQMALLAAVIGVLFAWWSAPFVVARINPPDNPARLVLSWDWRVLAFSLMLTVSVTCLFGLLPALRASGVRPSSALKGGEDPHARRRLMHALIAVQVAFGFVVLFVAGLFAASFDRLANQPPGFSPDRLLAVDAVSQPPQQPIFWEQVAAKLRGLPEVESVALAGWPLMAGNGSNGFVAIEGAAPGPILNYFLNVSPGWIETMKIPLIEGRDFRPTDVSPGAALINQAFAKEYFPGRSPIGKSFERTYGRDHFQVAGVVANARYRNMREPITPTAYIPFRRAGPELLSTASFLVRTSSSNPLTLAPLLRAQVPRARPGFRVSNIRTQLELNQSQTLRERLLATLALFFAVLALLLAGIGLYGVLNYSVLQRRREIGIRIAIGAGAADVARRVTSDVFAMVLTGAVAGIALGMGSARYIEALLYRVEPGSLSLLAVPSAAILIAAPIAALAPVIRAIRIDPAAILRAE